MARCSDWIGKYVDLAYGRVTLRDVKSRVGDVRDRIVVLHPRALRALRQLGGDASSGRVFRRADGSPWHADPRTSGAQLNRLFQDIAREAGLNRPVVLHMIRHSWASWHYAVHRDLKRLREEGAWESLEMADRFSHLAPSGMASEILDFWEASG